MTHLLYPSAAFLLAVLLSQGLVAQITSPMSGEPSAPGPTCPVLNQEPSETSARCNTLARASNPIIAGTHISLTTSGLGGYDSAFDGRESLGAAFEGGRLYANARFHTGKNDLLLSNAFTAINYQTGQNTRVYLDSTTFSFSRLSSERTAMGLDITNSYGNDSIRLMAPAGSASSDAGSYGIHTGTVFVNQATGRVSRQMTETRWWSASIRNNFRNFTDDNSEVNTIDSRFELHYQPSPRGGIGLYEETANESGSVNCTTQGFGVAYERRFSSVFSGEVSAGPAFGTKGCVVTVTSNYFASLSAHPWRPTTVYFSAYRRLNDSSFVAATYENTLQGGLNQQIGMSALLKIQGGTINGTVPSRVAPFHGYYIDGTYERFLSRGISFSFSAQHFNWSGISNIAPQRTLVMGTLTWTSNSRSNRDTQGTITY